MKQKSAPYAMLHEIAHQRQVLRLERRAFRAEQQTAKAEIRHRAQVAKMQAHHQKEVADLQNQLAAGPSFTEEQVEELRNFARQNAQAKPTQP